jgi:hypothetical protein
MNLLKANSYGIQEIIGSTQLPVACIAPLFNQHRQATRLLLLRLTAGRQPLQKAIAHYIALSR